MTLKNTVDFSNYTTANEGSDLKAEGIRKAIEYDSYADQTKFVAVVLSEPLPLRAEDVVFFTKAPSTPGFLTDVRRQLGLSGSLQRRISKITFKARIVGHNSPHWFLPDPCDPAYSSTDADSRAKNLKLIAMHTSFTSTEDYQLQMGKKLPNRGDLVLVELDYNEFGYNLQTGTFIDVMEATDAYHNINGYVGESCRSSLASSFVSPPPTGPGGGSPTMWTTPNPAPCTGERIVSPLVGINPNSAFGTRAAGAHGGTDFATARGAPVLAIADGVIESWSKPPGSLCPDQPPNTCGPGKCSSRYPNCQCGDCLGNYIVLKHTTKDPDGRDIRSLYAHLSEYVTSLPVGTSVTGGTQIGMVGSSGNSSDYHLHLEVRIPGSPDAIDSAGRIDPVAFINVNSAGTCPPSP